MLIDKSKMLDVRESHFIWQVNKQIRRPERKFWSETMRDKHSNFMIFLVVKLLRAHEGCLGIGRR